MKAPDPFPRMEGSKSQLEWKEARKVVGLISTLPFDMTNPERPQMGCWQMESAVEPQNTFDQDTQQFQIALPRASGLLPRRLMVRLRTLTPSIEVRILTGHPG